MNKKLHILFLSSWYPSKGSPNNGNFVQRHAEAIATKHNVTVIYVVTDVNLKNKLYVNYKINNVITKLVYLPKYKNKFLKIIYFSKAYISAINQIEKIDLVHVNITFPVGLVALYLKWFLHKVYIISEHWTGYLSNKNKNIGFFQKLITKTIIKNANYVCPVSKTLKNKMLDFGLKGSYYCVPNVINTAIFHPKPKTEKRFTIVHISTLNNIHKNIIGILNVISKLSKYRNDFVFKIIGEFPVNYIQKQIDELHLPKECIQIEFTKTPKEISDILQNANLYVSFSNYETFGIVMCEALACGVPVISTKTGILNELNFDNMVKLISIGDEHALLKQIIGFLDGDNHYNSESTYVQIQKQFGVEKISDEFSQLYFKSLNK